MAAKALQPDQAKLRVVADGESPPSLQSILGEEAPRGRRQWPRLRWLVVAVAVIAAGLAAWYWYGGSGGYAYTTQNVTRGGLTVLVTATGTVQPVAQVDVSTAISGIVRKVNVDYNSPVHAGDVLAELDTRNLSAAVSGARARLAAATANMGKAKGAADTASTQFDRQAALHDRGIVSLQTLDDARQARDASASALEAAKSEVLVAQADLEQAQTNLSWATITSPIDGVVLKRNIDEGSTVAASFQAPVLFSIAGDLRQMEVQVDVDEADIGSVSVGQEASFSVDAYLDRDFPARISTIRFVPETVNNVVTYKAVLEVDNSDLSLRPGMTATADIVVRKVDEALLVPNAALRYTPPQEEASRGFLFFRAPNMDAVTTADKAGGLRTVWVMRGGVPAATDIEIGATDGQNTQALSGDLKEGDAVITDAAVRQ